MKKFKYAIGIAAMALFGACSSDAPENVTPTDQTDEGMMYISVKIKGDDLTRAFDESTAADATVVAGESTIKTIQLFIYDKDEDLYLRETVKSLESDANGLYTAYFEIDSQKFQDMLTRKNEEMKVVLYANASRSLVDTDDMLHGVTDSRTWGIATEEGVNPNGFIMSNAVESKAAFDAPTAADVADETIGTNKQKSWTIRSNVQLSRLATRFEWGSDNLASYEPKVESGISMELVGFDVETHSSSTYRLSTFSEDGVMPETPTLTNHCHYAPTSKFKYRVTEKLNASDAVGVYSDYNCNTLTSAADHQYTYMRPNTVSASYNYFTGNDEYKNYQYLPYAVIKAEFKCNKFAGTGKPSVSMAAGEPVYAVGGVFIGGYSDFLNLRSKNAKFSVKYDETAGLDAKEIEDIVKVYNDVLEYKLPYDDSKAEDAGKNEAWFVKFFPGAQKFEDQDTNKDDDVHAYYTYYASLIIHDGSKDEPQWKYGVTRNISYALTVSTIKLLGSNGEDKVGETPKGTDFTKLFIDVTCEAKKWKLNVENKWNL